MEHRMITIALALGALSVSEDPFVRHLAKNATFALHQFAGFDYGDVPDEIDFWDWIEDYKDEPDETPTEPESAEAQD